MATDPKIPIDDPDDEVLPASPARRRAKLAIGCLIVLGVLVFLIWFAVTHTGTADRPGRFGT
ncbi:MAG TPA: hypothetical protein VF167_05705 [Longimicrobiaceae bacterium]